MRAKLQNGFIVNGRLANIFVSRGIATQIDDTETKEELIEKVETPIQIKSEPKVDDTETKEPVKRKRRTKTEIEADKKLEK